MGPERDTRRPCRRTAVAAAAWAEPMAAVGAADPARCVGLDGRDGAARRLGVLRALAIGLGQPANWFVPVVTPDPEVLVKIIRYPARSAEQRLEPGRRRSPRQWADHVHHAGRCRRSPGAPRRRVRRCIGDARRVHPQPRRDVAAGHRWLPEGHQASRRQPAHRTRTDLRSACYFNPRMEATMAPIPLPASLARAARRRAETPIHAIR